MTTTKTISPVDMMRSEFAATTAATIMTIAVTETSGSILTAFCVVSLKNLLIMKPAPIGRMTTCTIEMNIDIMSTLTVSLRSR